MEQVVRAVLKAGQLYGDVAQYYADNAYWQAPLRHRIHQLSRLYAHNKLLAKQEGVSLIAEVNSRYNTRHSASDFPIIYDEFLGAIMEFGWLSKTPPILLGSDNHEATVIANTYIYILKNVAKRSKKRPFSLLTKWLHLSFPNTFVIYDQNVAQSVLCWSNYSLGHINKLDLERLQFNVEARHWVNHWDDAGWYYGLLEFYRRLWTATQQAMLEKEMEQTADSISKIMKAIPTASHAQVTTIGLIDSLLWKAKGNSAVLGLTDI